ncbi:hypothetical protein C5167_012183 [Papaver somniferum]|uniref:Uncharacterized protein n=1 Tax=Papaver somniferum TaxID=3469 RepID=A0A4Y7J0P6_PAPSO|nr:hypothetical protein C5167_012183 [Papaver somniferum]
MFFSVSFLSQGVFCFKILGIFVTGSDFGDFLFNACTIITRFTRIVGELFGVLIAVLLIQEAIKGMVSDQFRSMKIQMKKDINFSAWLYTNGLLGLIFTFGLLSTSLKSRRARSWRYGTCLEPF